jgi:hypothetical protein
MELISRLDKYKCENTIIEYINPYSEIGEYQFSYDEINSIVNWIKYIDSIIDILIDPEDISIMTNLSVLTALQIFIYYTKYREINYSKPSEFILACYILVIILYNEDCNILSRPMLDKIINRLPSIIKKKNIQKNIDLLLEFFNYDFFSIPLTINYLIYISDPYIDDYDDIMDNIDLIIRKAVLKNIYMMDKNPYELTRYILEKL